MGCISGFPTRSDTNWAVQPQKMAEGLKLRILKVEVLHYLCRKNKGADQVTMQLICTFVFANAKSWVSHEAHLSFSDYCDNWYIYKEWLE